MLTWSIGMIYGTHHVEFLYNHVDLEWILTCNYENISLWIVRGSSICLMKFILWPCTLYWCGNTHNFVIHDTIYMNGLVIYVPYLCSMLKGYNIYWCGNTHNLLSMITFTWMDLWFMSYLCSMLKVTITVPMLLLQHMFNGLCKFSRPNVHHDWCACTWGVCSCLTCYWAMKSKIFLWI